MRNINDIGTIAYYDRAAKEYFNQTVSVDMSEIAERFLEFVKPGGRIIDIGVGSGRDVLYFKEKGYQVEGIDASFELCKLASEYTGVEIKCEKVQNWHPVHKYDGIWANASLVHLTVDEIEEFLLRMPQLLFDDGSAYLSFKSGIVTTRDFEGRYFSNIAEEQVRRVVDNCESMEILDIWKTDDKLNRKSFGWINFILKKK